jgi:2-polyprenyl-3-methyl-5-hydroxy-6-metoxy-1,4-benzoquinol methylase
LFDPIELTLQRCRTCSLVALSPRLAQDAIESVEDASTFYDLELEQVAEHLNALDGLLEWLERSVVSRGQLLDIGCNRGFLLEAARRRGWKVTGVELSEVAANRARDDFGLPVYSNVGEVRPQSFDLVTAWHVLEHTLDPVAFLREAASVLAADGILAIQVPSFAALGRFIERSMFSSLVCAVHNFYFEPETLTRTITTAGFAVVDLVEDDIMLTATCIRDSTAPGVPHGRPTVEHNRA